MKPILEWLEEAKLYDYSWAGAAIRNYISDLEYSPSNGEVDSLRMALVNAFDWTKSPEKYEYWDGVSESLHAAEKEGTPMLKPMIEYLGKLNNAIGNLEHNYTLKEPYRTQVYEATKASYEEQLAEVKTEIAEKLGMGNLSGLSSELEEAHEEIGRLKREYDAITDTERNLRKEIGTLRKDLERQVSHTKSIEKELEAAKGKKLIGWVIQDKSGEYFRYVISNPVKIGDAWKGCSTVLGEYLTLNEITKAGYPVPSWSDDEPIPIYE